jgi:hypothetical protein
MSGSGKSYWSEKLSRQGFKLFCLDALIAQKLSAELRREDGSIPTLGEWMGFPFQDGYQRRENLYLSSEKQLMAETLDWIDENVRTGLHEENVVLDTTGSVIYTGDDILKRLKSLTTVVNCTIPSVIREAMLKQYLSNPRPVLWRGLFSIGPGESIEEALFRSYNALLDSRQVIYHELADIEIDYFTRNSPDFKISDFLEIAGKICKNVRCVHE